MRRTLVLALLATAGCDCGGTEGLPPGAGDRVLPRIVEPAVVPVEIRPANPDRTRTNPVVLVPPILRGPTQVDVFLQEEATVDVLWVVDNSASLTNERARLATQFMRFLNVLIAASVDYHVGVTSTDLVSSGADGGRLRGAPRWIDRDTPNPEQVFAAALQFPADLDIRLEEGLAAMVAALTPPISTGPNAGFLREEAGLAVIVVSDEDDGSLGNVDQYIRFLRSLKGPGREVNVALSAVIGDVPGGCVDPAEAHIFGANARAGERYAEIATATGGLIESICSPNFAPYVEALATTLAGLRRFFPLSAPPDPSSIEVTVDGRVIPESPTIGWYWDDTRHGVAFDGMYVPAPGAEVRIEYDVAL